MIEEFEISLQEQFQEAIAADDKLIIREFLNNQNILPTTTREPKWIEISRERFSQLIYRDETVT